MVHLGFRLYEAQAAAPEATPPVAEHWAHGEYGWFLFEEGGCEVCLTNLRLIPYQFKSFRLTDKDNLCGARKSHFFPMACASLCTVH